MRRMIHKTFLTQRLPNGRRHAAQRVPLLFGALYLVGLITCTLEHTEVVPIEYDAPIRRSDGVVLSIDKLVIDYRLRGCDALNEFAKMVDMLAIRYDVEETRWSSSRIGTFKENVTIGFQNGCSFWVGVALNGSKTDWERVRIEFNPNKTARHAAFRAVLEYLNTHSRKMHTTIKRFDLAVDIPVARSDVVMLKDRRVYSERRHGAEWTQYLGAKSSTVGRVKLYNKQTEAKLSYPLTRLELTLDPATDFAAIPWPTVYYVETRQTKMDEFRLTDTERFILNALLQGCGTLDQLGRKTRQKMAGIMEQYIRPVQVTEADYNEVLRRVRAFLAFPQKGNKTDQVDADQAPPAPPPRWVELAMEQTPDYDLASIDVAAASGSL